MRHRPTCTANDPGACSRPWQVSGPRRRIAVALTLLSLTLVAAGCGSTSGTTAGDGGRDSANTVPSNFPVTVENCEERATFQHPPQRAVTMNQHATEIMLALGLEERMAGTAYLDDQILPKYRNAYEQVPVLAGEYPSYEKLLATGPDFVYGGYASAFDKQEGRSRSRLQDAGIKTYLNVASCADGPVTMEHVRQEIRTIAKIFGVPGRGRDVIQRLDASLQETESKLDGASKVSVFVYDSGKQAPVTAGGHGIANEIVKLAGGSNVFADVSGSFPDVSWEQVIKRSPQRIVILDYGATSVEEKKQRLLNRSALADVPAIKHRRFAVLPLSSAVAGIRVPQAVNKLARELHPGQFQ